MKRTGVAIRKLADYAKPKVNGRWPLLGVCFVGEVPKKIRLSVRYVSSAVQEGWMAVVGARVKQAPAGPPHDPFRSVHRFPHVDRIIFKTIDGPVSYEVVQQPGKLLGGEWAQENHSDAKVTWYFDADLEE